MKVLTGPVQARCSTRLVSRAEVVAEPPAVQLLPNTQAEDVALRLLQPAGVGVSQLWMPERMPGENALYRLVAARLATCGNWSGGPKNLQSPDPFRVIR